MSSRSVRLDKEAETALQDILQHTGNSISDTIKLSLVAYRDHLRQSSQKNPAEFFLNTDLGEGGYAFMPARQSKQVLKAKLKKPRC